VSALEFQFHRGGVFLPRLGLWLDSHTRQAGPERVFVSHAHSDHIGAHREVILTAATARLMQARVGGKRVEHTLEFGRPVLFNGAERPFQITLLPAGHIFGSTMAWLEADGKSLLYTGDFKLRPSLSAELCEPRPADVLIMETTFGRPKYCFPPAVEVFCGIINFCRETLADGATPVLLAYSLGKSQELLRGLADAGLLLMIHAQVRKMTRICEELGQTFPPCEVLDLESARGRVLILPPGGNHAPLLEPIGPIRTAVVSGWALDSSCRYRARADAAFPLSDHADFSELVEMVRRVSPRRVFTLHGFAADFAQTLRDLGFDAAALSEEDQLHFRLGV